MVYGWGRNQQGQIDGSAFSPDKQHFRPCEMQSTAGDVLQIYCGGFHTVVKALPTFDVSKLLQKTLLLAEHNYVDIRDITKILPKKE